MMRSTKYLLTALAATAALAASAAAGDGGRNREDRPAHDLQVRIKVSRKRSAEPQIRVVVRNRGTSSEEGAVVEVLADGTPVWSETFDLAPRRRARFRFRTSLPPGTETLTARVDHDGPDPEEPETPEDGGDDEDVEVVVPDGPPSDAALGAAIYAAQCASCHGADALGTPAGPDIVREDAEEILEAVREGEDGMPTYPGIGWTEARQLEAFLKDPLAVTPPDPTPDPTPDPVPVPDPGTTTTYSGSVKALLDSRCVACHRGSSASGGIALDTYAAASTNAAASLASIRAGRMPPGGSLSAADIALVEAWINDGKPQ